MAEPNKSVGREEIYEILIAMHARMLVMGYDPGDGVRVVLPRRLFVQAMMEAETFGALRNISPSEESITRHRDWTTESPLPDSFQLYTPAGRLTVSL